MSSQREDPRSTAASRAFSIAAPILLSAALVCPAAEPGPPSPAAGAPGRTSSGAAVPASPAPASPAPAPTPPPPPAAPPPAAAPVLSFAWVSDLHLDAATLESARAAFRWIDETLAPDFVLFTGDNNSMPAPPRSPAAPEPQGVRRHRFFKEFLAAHLRAPAVVIPGDNWPDGFDQVFGASQRSFDCAGLHFLLLAPDRSCKQAGMEGLSVFDAGTLAWVRKDLEANRDKPTVAAIHEPIHPPSFLDAILMRRLLAPHPQVLAVFQGHIHVEMNLAADGKAYLTAPALKPSAAPALKQVLVFPDRLAVRTFARDPRTGAFAPPGRDRNIAVPPALGARLRRPEGGFRMENHDEVPPHPHVDDPSLAARKWEFLRNLSEFLDGDVRPSAEKSPPAEAEPPAEQGR